MLGRKLNQRITRLLDRQIYDGSKLRRCSLCGWSGLRFRTNWHPIKTRFDCVCPSCGSYERHRLAHTLISNKMQKFGSVFHVAPEPVIKKWLQQRCSSYISGDIDPRNADRQEDLTALSFSSESFDTVFCSHVLEHILDDGSAMAELHRVVKPEGVVILQVPIWGDKTVEGDVLLSETERERLFFQKDHVRLYGRSDFKFKLVKAGFHVEVLSIYDLPQDEVLLGGLSYPSTNEIFLCTKTNIK